MFTGDAAEAERSQVLDKLREDLENKKYLVNQFFAGRQVTLVVEFRSVDGKVGSVVDTRKTPVYDLPLTDLITQPGPAGQIMHIGFIRLINLSAIHRDMGQRFFERNIRYGLGSSEAVNRAISRSLKQIVLDKTEHPAVFAFNHNGITLFAERVERTDGQYRMTAPRLLNGAQTVTTLTEFLNGNKDNPRLSEGRAALEDVRVMCRIITNASPEFITTVTINNNRQNPVEPWNLHANDMIQLELQDKFRSDLGIYYKRQEEALANLSNEEMEEQGITEGKAIELVRLGAGVPYHRRAIDKFSRMREVFEDDRIYSQVFSPARLKADSRHIVLCYKVHCRLRKLVNEIVDKGPSKYGFVNRGRSLVWALLCQGMLNDSAPRGLGRCLWPEHGRARRLHGAAAQLATTRVRMMLAELIKDRPMPTRSRKVRSASCVPTRVQALHRDRLQAVEVVEKRLSKRHDGVPIGPGECPDMKSARELLEELNSLDESARIEAKTGSEINKSIMETVSAANEPGLDGGYLLLGVRAKETLFDVVYEPEGLKDPGRSRRTWSPGALPHSTSPFARRSRLRRSTARRLWPPTSPRRPPTDKPLYLTRLGLPGAFRRLGPADHEGTDDDLIALYAGHRSRHTTRWPSPTPQCRTSTRPPSPSTAASARRSTPAPRS